MSVRVRFPKEHERTPEENTAIRMMMGRVILGRRVRNFRSTEFYKENFAPYLSKKKGTLEDSKDWRPGDPASTFEAIALGVAHRTGCKDELKDLESQLEEWVGQGIEAETELKKRGVEV